jgi:hypothetical protein
MVHRVPPADVFYTGPDIFPECDGEELVVYDLNGIPHKECLKCKSVIGISDGEIASILKTTRVLPCAARASVPSASRPFSRCAGKLESF